MDECEEFHVQISTKATPGSIQHRRNPFASTQHYTSPHNLISHKHNPSHTRYRKCAATANDRNFCTAPYKNVFEHGPKYRIFGPLAPNPLRSFPFLIHALINSSSLRETSNANCSFLHGTVIVRRIVYQFVRDPSRTLGVAVGYSDSYVIRKSFFLNLEAKNIPISPYPFFVSTKQIEQKSSA